eukprot:4406071-Amphidinium_carterae.1
MRSGLCSREEAADAYYLVNVACSRVAKPDGQLQALQRSIQMFPQCATRPAWLHSLGLTRAAGIMERSELGRSHPLATLIRRNLARIEARSCSRKQQTPLPSESNIDACIDAEPIQLLAKRRRRTATFIPLF